jgi:hypothetical protein
VLGVYLLVGACVGASRLVFQLVQICLQSDPSSFGAPEWRDIALDVFGPMLVSVGVGLALIAYCPYWLDRLVRSDSESPMPAPSTALRLGLQLLGVYFCLCALPELPRALLDGMHQLEDTRLTSSDALYTARPLDVTIAFGERWNALITCVVQVVLGAWVALRAESIATRLERRGAGEVRAQTA